MPIQVSGVQYSGLWNLSSQANAKAAGTWPVPITGLFGWGRNNFGNLGLGNTTNYSSPKQITSTNGWLSVASGSNSVAAIKPDGTLWGWGYNAYGQLGLGNTTSYSSPKQVGSLTNWLTLTTTYNNVIAVKTNGTLWSWGQGTYGVNGLGNVTSYSSPKQVGALTNWSAVYGDNYVVMAVKTDGTLWGWGSNYWGNLGLGNTVVYYSSPKQVGSLTNWATLSGAGNAPVAVKTDGTLWAWGYNGYGNLGLGNVVNYSSPKQVGALTNWQSVNSGLLSGVGAIKTNGTLWSWGQNQYGQLGQGDRLNRSSPTQVGSLNTWSKVGTGLISMYGIQSNGTLWAWGGSPEGQLGLGNITYYSSPKQVGSLTNWTSMASIGLNYNFFAQVG